MIKRDGMLIVPAEVPPSNSALTTTIKPEAYYPQVHPARIFILSYHTLKERMGSLNQIYRGGESRIKCISCTSGGGESLEYLQKMAKLPVLTPHFGVHSREVCFLLMRFSVKFPCEFNLPPFSSHQEQLVRQT